MHYAPYITFSPFLGSLSGLLHLHELDLSDNSLRFVQYGVLEDLYFLSQLKLGGNPWMCDYRWVLPLISVKISFAWDKLKT